MPDDVTRLSALAAEMGGDDPQLVLDTLKVLAETDRTGKETDLRIDFAKKIIRLFGIANGFVGGGVAIAYFVDIQMINGGILTPEQRLITVEVVLALVAATAAQLGAIAIALARSMFAGSE
jgi:hypothetical protein